ncbi:MAG: Txe/YoeB family addiction module toxin [Proteobacteria bacterium]|nr:Txe/YoeB family addiction module toxin [Pseudomonadota bacterium]MBU1715205.1 Txe/YoeB family addiction module toxin [Pseudomonadota bacterium]
MKLSWADKAWEDYLYWQQTDKKIMKRINLLIKEIRRNPFTSIGDPEPLRFSWTGYWSRRINKEHRFVYRVKNNELLIAQCRFHY